MSLSNPREMQDFLWLSSMTGSVDLRPHGTAEAGKIYQAPDGWRFFYGRYDPDAIFCLIKPNPGHEAKGGKFFQQNINWFGDEVGRNGFTGALHLSATKAVIEGFMDIFMGVAAAAGGPLAAGIAGMNMLVTAGKIKQDWNVYRDVIEVLLYNREFIKTNAPMLYNIVMIELLYGHLEKTLTSKTKDALLNAIPGPKVAGKVAGVFLGKFGEDDFKERLKGLSYLFNEVLVKVANHAASKWPEKLEKQQVYDLAFHHVTKPLNVKHWIKYMDQDTGEKIIRETVDNCLGLKGPFKKIGAALQKFGA